MASACPQAWRRACGCTLVMPARAAAALRSFANSSRVNGPRSDMDAHSSLRELHRDRANASRADCCRRAAGGLPCRSSVASQLYRRASSQLSFQRKAMSS